MLLSLNMSHSQFLKSLSVKLLLLHDCFDSNYITFVLIYMNVLMKQLVSRQQNGCVAVKHFSSCWSMLQRPVCEVIITQVARP